MVVPPIDINDYPALKQHLDQYWDRIERRDDKGITPYNLRNCAYWGDFSKPKIVYSETNNSNEIKIAIDTEKCLTDKTCFILHTTTENKLEHIYKIMSSNLFIWYMRLKSPLLGKKGISLTKVTVVTFPMAKESTLSVYQCYDLTPEEIAFIENED